MNTQQTVVRKNGTWFSSGDPGAGPERRSPRQARPFSIACRLPRSPRSATTSTFLWARIIHTPSHRIPFARGRRRLLCDAGDTQPTDQRPTRRGDPVGPTARRPDGFRHCQHAELLEPERRRQTTLLADTLFTELRHHLARLVRLGACGQPLYGRKYWETRFWSGSIFTASCGVAHRPPRSTTRRRRTRTAGATATTAKRSSAADRRPTRRGTAVTAPATASASPSIP